MNLNFSALLTIGYGKTRFDLREKLARLLLDPGFTDKENELEKPRKTYGMLLKNLRERHLFDTSSEEDFYEHLSRLGEHYEDVRVSSSRKIAPSIETLSTTTASTTTNTITTTLTTTSEPLVGQNRQPLIAGIERLGIIVNKFINLWMGP